jgi:Tol biopolymer transport system component
VADARRNGRYVVHVKVEGADGGLWLRQVATSSDVRIVPPTSAPYGGVTLSADGEFVYYTVTPGATGLLYRVPALGGTPERLVEGVDGPVSFSPDGKRMAFFRAQAPGDRTELMLANSDGSNVRSVANMPRRALSFPGPSWAPFGDTVLISVGSEANTQFTPHSVDLRTGAATAVGGAWRAINHLEWMPDGRSFLLAGLPLIPPPLSPHVWQVSFPAGTLNRVTRDSSTYLTVRPTADGRTLAAVVADPRAAIWLMPLSDPAQRTRITRNDRLGAGVFGVAWTPDGGIAYSAIEESEAFQIYRSSLDGSHIRQLTTSAYFKGYVDVARAANVLAYYEVREDRRAILRTYLDGPGTRELLVSGRVTPPLVSPDGEWICYADEASGQSTAYRVSSKGGTPEALGGAHRHFPGWRVPARFRSRRAPAAAIRRHVARRPHAAQIASTEPDRSLVPHRPSIRPRRQQCLLCRRPEQRSVRSAAGRRRRSVTLGVVSRRGNATAGGDVRSESGRVVAGAGRQTGSGRSWQCRHRRGAVDSAMMRNNSNGRSSGPPAPSVRSSSIDQRRIRRPA